MKTAIVDAYRLAWHAMSRGLGRAGAIGLVVVVSLTTGLSARAIAKHLATHDPLQQAQRTAKLFGQWFPADVVARFADLPLLVVAVGLMLLALNPWLGAGYAAKLDPRESNSGIRTASALAATATVTVLALIAAGAATCVAAPGMMSAKYLLLFSQMAGIAVLASLPSVAVAIVVRNAFPGPRVGPYLALGAALGVRYGVPLLLSKDELARWLVPRTYELGLLSSSTEKVMTMAALCVAWSVGLLVLADGVARLGSWVSRRSVSAGGTRSTLERASGSEV